MTSGEAVDTDVLIVGFGDGFSGWWTFHPHLSPLPEGEEASPFSLEGEGWDEEECL